MAMTDKEAALEIIARLPDDASFDEIVHALSAHEIGPSRTDEAGDEPAIRHQEVRRPEDEVAPVQRRLVSRGHLAVLEPTRPVPSITVELVNQLVDEARRERDVRSFQPETGGL